MIFKMRVISVKMFPENLMQTVFSKKSSDENVLFTIYI